ncbi:MAG: hypothetical protein VX958_00760 [Planctomycetota bacterium]|nr:hypothetical protein [Planctomycetota bacterium]
MSEEKVKDDLYQRVEEHLQELLEPELPEARLSPGERLELLEQARSSESCRELLEAYEKTISLVSALPDKPVPVDFGAKVGETIEADTPVIPFYKTELFQRMLGAVGAIALIAMVFWDAFPPAVEESPLQLADNVARPGAARENLAEELPIAPVAVEIAKPAEADRDAVEGIEELDGGGAPVRLVEDAPEPGPETLAAAPSAGEPVSAAAPEAAREEIAREIASAKRVSVSAASEASGSPPPPGGAELAAPAGAADSLADAAAAVKADEPAPVVAEKPAGNKPATGIEVSRESVNGRLVAVRYEVEVSRSRLGELNAWRKTQSSQALSVARASQAAPLGLSSRLRARGIVPRQRAENAVSQPETLKLLVDPGRLDGLRVELGRLQGPAAAAPAENSAKKKPTPGVSSSRGRRSVNSLPGIRPGAKKKAAGSKARTPEKAAAAKVRVEIRFRIVSD